jgi:hypothetical protein
MAMKVIQEAFNRVDKDGSGKISREEFAMASGKDKKTFAMASGKDKKTLVAVDQIFREYDADASGQMDLSEFRYIYRMSYLYRICSLSLSLSLSLSTHTHTHTHTHIQHDDTSGLKG